MRLFGRKPEANKESGERDVEQPSIFINQAKIQGEPKELDGIIEITLQVMGGRPRNEMGGMLTARITSEQLETIDNNDGYINPENELGFIKDDIGLITPEAKLVVNQNSSQE